MNLETLNKLCVSSGNYNTDLATPSLIEVDGEQYTLACDGSMFLAVKGVISKPISEKRVNVFSKFLQSKEDKSAISTTVEKLREWAGEVSWEFDCQECEGKGKSFYCEDCDGGGYIRCTCPHCDDYHETECNSCAGVGKTAISAKGINCDACNGSGKSPLLGGNGIESGEIMGLFVDLRRVARLVETLSGDCIVWTAEGGLNARGDNWHFTLMPVRTTEGPVRIFQHVAN